MTCGRVVLSQLLILTPIRYLPFNGGPRICLGQQFALTEASYTTVRLCQAFKAIESRDAGPWRESLTLTCVNWNGAKVALTRHNA